MLRHGLGRKHRHPAAFPQAPYSSVNLRTKPFLGAEAPDKQTPGPDDARSAAADLMTRSQRAMRWLQPGLVVKRWLLTSGLGLLMALLGAAIWADLKPIY